MRRAAVVTVSDSVVAGARVDESGPALRTRLEASGWQVSDAEATSDDTEAIVEVLTRLCRTGVPAIFTTGGTGLGPRDNTPEATRRVIEKEVPGIAERMRAEGLKRTPLAALSRAIAGACGATLIVNLPGSPKGAVESLDAILEIVPHAADLLAGNTRHDAMPKRG